MEYTNIATRFGRIARHLMPRDDDDAKCHPQPNIDLCEKPATSGHSTTITIAVIVAVIVIGTFAVLTFLHLRRKRMDKEEWPKSQQELEDYGFASSSTGVRQPPAAHYNQQGRQDHHRGASLDHLERSLRGS
ncbi:hypothetical protein GGR50DRAFT_97794 [Xylaria sp. CBS 124048]|nr:hypothetical protein GGR50DRAFT_97794 [Xylaria sp. CBS 124048]